MSNERTTDSLREKFQEIKRNLREERKNEMRLAQGALKNLLDGVEQGIQIREVYKQLEEKGFSEDSIRSAYLDLAQGDEIDLTSERHLVLMKGPEVK